MHQQDIQTDQFSCCLHISIFITSFLFIFSVKIHTFPSVYSVKNYKYVHFYIFFPEIKQPFVFYYSVIALGQFQN